MSEYGTEFVNGTLKTFQIPKLNTHFTTSLQHGNNTCPEIFLSFLLENDNKNEILLNSSAEKSYFMKCRYGVLLQEIFQNLEKTMFQYLKHSTDVTKFNQFKASYFELIGSFRVINAQLFIPTQ